MSDDSPRAPGVTIRETVAPVAPSEPPAASPPEAGLDGDSLDYRYIQVRRTLIYIEQSIKDALNQFVFQPSTPTTWSQVVSAVTGVLQEIWSRGEMAGATPEQAFDVQCGLGSTMTAQDLRDGNLVVQVTLRGIRPTPTVLTVRLDLQGGA